MEQHVFYSSNNLEGNTKKGIKMSLIHFVILNEKCICDLSCVPITKWYCIFKILSSWHHCSFILFQSSEFYFVYLFSAAIYYLWLKQIKTHCSMTYIAIVYLLTLVHFTPVLCNWVFQWSWHTWVQFNNYLFIVMSRFIYTIGQAGYRVD